MDDKNLYNILEKSIIENDLIIQEYIVSLYPIFKIEKKLINIIDEMVTANYDICIEKSNIVLRLLLLMIKYDENISLPDNSLITKIIDLESLKKIQQSHHSQNKKISTNKIIKNKYSSFLDIDDELFVNNITIDFMKHYINTNSNEILYGLIYETKNQHLFPNFIKMNSYFEKISYLIPNLILSYADHHKQYLIVNKIIKIAELFLKNKNYHMLFSIVSGLYNRNINRLTYLWNNTTLKKFKKLEAIISPIDNFQAYRNLTNNQNNYIPYLGIMFTKIKHNLEESVYDINTGKLNFNLLNKMHDCIMDYGNINNFRFNDVYDEGICQMIDNFKITFNDDDLYHLSISCLPDNQINVLVNDKMTIYDKNYKDWNVSDVCKFLKYIGVKSYEDVFVDHEIDGLAFMYLNNKDLKQLGVDNDSIKVIINAIELMQITSIHYDEVLHKKINKWNINDVVCLLKQNDMSQYIYNFIENEIDGNALMYMTFDEYKSMDMTDKDIEKFLNTIKNNN